MDSFFEKSLDGVAYITSSPTCKTKIYGDRFIPIRKSETWQRLSPNFSPTAKKTSKNPKEQIQKKSRDMYNLLLQNELLHENGSDDLSSSPDGESKSVFQYCISNSPRSRSQDANFSFSPLAQKSQKLLETPKMHRRDIPTSPYKSLGAPGLEDDFYLNLLDWSSQNIIAVALGPKVYLWNASNHEVLLSRDFSNDDVTEVTSVAFNDKGNYLSVGVDTGDIYIWDICSNKILFKINIHADRAGCLHWNGDLLASGSKDRKIMVTDVRSNCVPYVLLGHRQEVCGLKWSPNSTHLASGSNDNRLHVWNPSSTAAKPMISYLKHTAAVKALAWSPHQHHLLASGGGTADGVLRIWNVLSKETESVQCIGVESQICTLNWLKHTNELISTHGFSQNEIVIWEYPSMERVARLNGHKTRVLYSALSPDGRSLVTGAGDEMMKFWNIYPKSKSCKVLNSPLNMFNGIR